MKRNSKTSKKPTTTAKTKTRTRISRRATGMSPQERDDVDNVRRRERQTDEVGSEGGSPGDVEVHDQEVGTGSEAGETWRPVEEREQPITRDETGVGRRSP